MNYLLTIKTLYVLNGFVAVLLYLPQIHNAWKDKKRALALSLFTFGGWSIGSLVTALYAWVYVKDGVFTAISLGNMAGSGALFLIVVCSRVSSRKNSFLSADSASLLHPLPAGNETDRAAGLAQQLP